MAIVDLNTLKSTLPKNVRLLGLDVGQKTIGLSISDQSLMIASPLETIRRKKFSQDVIRLKEIIEEFSIGALIIGLPLNMDGTEGPRCQPTRQFAKNNLNYIDLPMAFWDERLSTQAVTRPLIEADLSRAKRSKVIDKLAASYILQGVLDYLRN